MEARRHSVARWSTFEEMDITFYALATKKGDEKIFDRVACLEAKQTEGGLHEGADAGRGRC